MKARDIAKKEMKLKDKIRELTKKSIDYAKKNPGKENPYEKQLQKLSS